MIVGAGVVVVTRRKAGQGWRRLNAGSRGGLEWEGNASSDAASLPSLELT
jgi:hypothetical protein